MSKPMIVLDADVLGRQRTGDESYVSALLRELPGLDDQLRSLPANAPDDVAAAHRASVERTLEEVRLALHLHGEGRYGTCIRCADPISVVRLEARPWATRCIRCADRVGW